MDGSHDSLAGLIMASGDCSISLGDNPHTHYNRKCSCGASEGEIHDEFCKTLNKSVIEILQNRISNWLSDAITV